MRRALFCLALALGCACAKTPAALVGAPDSPGRRFAERYCASCHTQAGAHRLRPRAHGIFAIDRISEWRGSQRILLAVLDKWHLDGKVMPPPQADAQPSDDERRAILDWIRRGSPDSPSVAKGE